MNINIKISLTKVGEGPDWPGTSYESWGEMPQVENHQHISSQRSNIQIMLVCMALYENILNIPRRERDCLAWAKGLWMRGTLMRLYLSPGIRYLHVSFCISINAGHEPNISRNPAVYQTSLIKERICTHLSAFDSIGLSWWQSKCLNPRRTGQARWKYM